MHPHPTSWRPILRLSSYLRLGLPSGLFPPVFPTENMYTPLLSSIHATCPAHLILLVFITRPILAKEYRWQAYHYVVFSTPLLPCPPWPKYPLQNPILRHPQPTDITIQSKELCRYHSCSAGLYDAGSAKDRETKLKPFFYDKAATASRLTFWPRSWTFTV